MTSLHVEITDGHFLGQVYYRFLLEGTNHYRDHDKSSDMLTLLSNQSVLVRNCPVYSYFLNGLRSDQPLLVHELTSLLRIEIGCVPA